MHAKKVRSLWLVVLAEVAVLALAALLVLRQPEGGALYVGLRLAALVGLGLIYLSIWSSLFVRELTRALGRPFVRAHHVLSIVGLALATLHPIAVVTLRSSPSLLLPSFSSWTRFLQRLGPLVWLLLMAGLVAALLRTRWKQWRWLHWLNYVAFFAGVVHAWRLGSDVQGAGMRVLLALLAASVAAAFVWKRLKVTRKPARKPTAA
ncbi:MAG: hypothetical protein GX557_09350 [Chloroflexi bacterium]|nr:hypothetical protein [Chloroflexota bacterium]